MKTYIRVFDDRLTRFIKSWPKWLHQPMLAITNSGQPLTVLLFTGVLLVWAYTKNNTEIATSCSIVLLTVIIASILKVLLRRNRPETDYVARMWFKSYSFPSGHSAAATVGFGFLAYLLVNVDAGPLGVLLAIAFATYALLVGISRVYLGAHFPSDVLGGMIIGGAGLLAVIVLVRPFA